MNDCKIIIVKVNSEGQGIGKQSEQRQIPNPLVKTKVRLGNQERRYAVQNILLLQKSLRIHVI